MSWTLKDREFRSLMDSEAARRYWYAVRRMAEHGEVWSLKSADGWVLMADDEGRQIIPVWPHPRYAVACATEYWSDTEPEAIKLEYWMERWQPAMEQQGKFISVFPVASCKGVIVQPKRLGGDLEGELLLYE